MGLGTGICSQKPIQDPLKSTWRFCCGAKCPQASVTDPVNQRRCNGVSFDTSLINFSLSSLIFNYLLLLGSTSVCMRSDRMSLLLLKNGFVEAMTMEKLQCRSSKAGCMSSPRNGSNHHYFLKDLTKNAIALETMLDLESWLCLPM